MADCDWPTPEGRIITLLDRRVESVHVDVNDLANSPFVHLWRLTCVSRHLQSNRSRPATMPRTLAPRGRRKHDAEKEDSRSQSLDEGRRAATQSLFEGENACGGRCESNEANRGCSPAKGEDDRDWSRSSPLRIATHNDSPKSGGPLDAPVYPGGVRFARPAIKAVEDAVLTLATKLEQI